MINTHISCIAEYHTEAVTDENIYLFRVPKTEDPQF